MKHSSQNAFSVLEMMTSMTIFSVMGFSLFGMFNALTTMQTVSLGIQHFKEDGYQLLERIGQEVSEAMTGTMTVFEPGTNNRINCIPQFICTDTSGNPLSFAGNTVGGKDFHKKNGFAQLFFTKCDYSFPDKINDIHSEKVLWGWGSTKSPLFSERILYVSGGAGDSPRLQLYARTEKTSSLNKVTGEAKINLNGGYVPGEVGNPMYFSSVIDNIEYLFWGSSNKDWQNYESPLGTLQSGPIREWNSTIAVPGVHEINELPKAMKILLTMTYNPERDHRRGADLNANKNHLLVFEKIVIFKYRG